MYLSLENNVLLPKGKILGIFDLETTGGTAKDFLRQAEREGRVVTVCTDLPRCFVLVVEDFGNTTLYLTGKSGRSLQERYHRIVGENPRK